jgi:hypothetical protein
MPFFRPSVALLSVGLVASTLTVTSTTVTGDVDGDGIADMSTYRTNGQWEVRESTGSYNTLFTKTLGGAGYTGQTGDVDGDGRRDFVVYRESTGDWQALLSSSGYTTLVSYTWGGPHQRPVLGDYDGDGKADIAVYAETGAVGVTPGTWCILTSSSGYTSSVTRTWGAGDDVPVPGQDFDGDGIVDFTVFNPRTYAWHILKSSTAYSEELEIDLGIRGDLVPGDYDGDGKADPAVYQPFTGHWYIAKSSAAYAVVLDLKTSRQLYDREGTRLLDTPVPDDYDGDGRTDPMVFQRYPGGYGWTYLKSSTEFATEVTPSGYAGPNAVVGDNPVTTAIHVHQLDPALRAADVDGDGKADFTVYNPSTDTNWYSLLSGAGYSTTLNTRWGGAGYTPVPADYDGDGKPDRALYEQATGNWYVLFSGTNFTTAVTMNVGGPGWTPIPADFDGDGKADFAVYNTATGLWYALKSSSNHTTTLSINWGGGGYTPAPGDIDGDGKADLAVYGGWSWYVLLSSTNYSSVISLYFGSGDPNAIPVLADFDGDGLRDLGNYSPTTGEWRIYPSGGGFGQSLIQRTLGGSGFMPVAGDFDGDGKADIAVYQASTGLWMYRPSGTNFNTVVSRSWGGPGYAATPITP